MNDLLTGGLVHLAAVNAQELGKAYAGWNRDSEFKRLAESDPDRLWSAKGIEGWLERKKDPENPNLFCFAIRRSSDGLLIGDGSLDVFRWNDREAFLGIALGDRSFWGKGYGSEALRLLLQFAFMELNLRRVSLTVNEYNPRAIRAYEKTGFVLEGRIRGGLNREGRRWDELHMGILREEWLVSQIQA